MTVVAVTAIVITAVAAVAVKVMKPYAVVAADEMATLFVTKVLPEVEDNVYIVITVPTELMEKLYSVPIERLFIVMAPPGAMEKDPVLMGAAPKGTAADIEPPALARVPEPYAPPACNWGLIRVTS